MVLIKQFTEFNPYTIDNFIKPPKVVNMADNSKLKPGFGIDYNRLIRLRI